MPPDVVRPKFSAGTHVNNQSTVYTVSSSEMDGMFHASEYESISLYMYRCVYIYRIYIYIHIFVIYMYMCVYIYIYHWVSKHLPLTGCAFITHPVGCNVKGFIFVFRFSLLGRKGKLRWCFLWLVWMEASSSQQPQEPQAAANITLKVIHVLPLLRPAAMACGPLLGLWSSSHQG